MTKTQIPLLFRRTLLRKHRDDLRLHHFVISKSQFGSHSTKLLQILYQMCNCRVVCVQKRSLAAFQLLTLRAGEDFVYLLIFPLFLRSYREKSRFVAAALHLFL